MGDKRSFNKKYARFIILVAITTYKVPQTHSEVVKFYWPEKDDRFNCMVAITVDGKPITSGLLLLFGVQNAVLTSANPLERVDNFDRVKVVFINGAYDSNWVGTIRDISKNQAMRNHGRWSTFGFDELHAPHHDILFVSLRDNTYTDYNKPKPGYPVVIKYTAALYFRPHGIFTIAAFGFIDRIHIKQNVQLEIVRYQTPLVLVDCNEWFPPIWGYFICLRNVENFVGVTSGAGLIYEGRKGTKYIAGVGAFSIKRGSESVLVFTDMRPYFRAGSIYCLEHIKGK